MDPSQGSITETENVYKMGIGGVRKILRQSPTPVATGPDVLYEILGFSYLYST